MPTISSFLVVGAIAFGLGAPLAACTKDDSQPTLQGANVKTVVIPVEGMTCSSCVAKVKRTLKAIDGVAEVEVSLADRNVKLSYDSKQVGTDRVVAALAELGYKIGTPAEASR